jgi:hypothetical protein
MGGTAHHQGSFGPRVSSRLNLFMHAFVLQKKGMANFFHIFLRQKWRRNPSSTPGRADLLLLPLMGNRHHHRH